MIRDLPVLTDIDSEPSPLSDEGRLLALLESAFGQRVPVYEVEDVGRLQYAARIHALRHAYGYVIVNGEDGRTAEGRRKTWFSLVGRLTRAQLSTLEALCRGKRARYNAAILQVFPQARPYLDRAEKREETITASLGPPPLATLFDLSRGTYAE